MALTNPNKVVTEERLNEYHRTILPYLGGNSMVACGGGYAPIGTVISYMGTRAPSDFLICDGTVYNIADYTELADFFEAQFGSSNFFGGDGNTTFAVPDLRGEFLRGTGTNSHANQGSGASVGVHQDGTTHIRLGSNDSTGSDIATYKSTKNPQITNADYTNDREMYAAVTGQVYSSHIDDLGEYTSRPTNTSVLYCIKAKSQGNGYSLDEQIVGTWIDGKPIYQRTWDNLSISLKAGNWYSTNIDSTNCRPVNAVAYAGGNDNFIKYINVRSNLNQWKLLSDVDVGTFTVLTIQYTKTTD